jgi:AraC-like DNA-binding protein
MQYLKTSLSTPIEFVSGGHFVSDVSWIHSKRIIDSFEIIIGVKETLYIEQEGIQYQVKPGDILLLLPDRTHQGYAMCSEKISFNWLHFMCRGTFEILDDRAAAEHLNSLKPPIGIHDSTDSIYIPIYSSPSNIERINILFHQILHVVNSNYYTFHGVHYLLMALLIEVTEQTISNFRTTNENTLADKNLSKIIEWIRIHSSGSITVSSIANAFSYNKDYFSHFFRQKMGVTLKDWIHIQKLSKAKDLLSRTTMSVKEIAHTIGINDDKYFMRLFKKYEKMTPTEFRKAYYRTHMNNK